jgi:hypothetical protein
MIKELSKCKLPFQCAHGRPTIVPLQNIFTRKVKKSNLSIDINIYYLNYDPRIASFFFKKSHHLKKRI